MKLTAIDSSVRHWRAFEPPARGLSRSALDKAHKIEAGAPVWHTFTYSRSIARVVAVALPILALLDAIAFFAKALFKAVILKKQDAAYDICQCGEALKLFFTSLGVLPVALFSPKSFYEPETVALARIRKNIQSEIEKLQKAEKEPTKKTFVTSCQRVASGLIKNEKRFDKIIETIAATLPEKENEASKVMYSNASEFFAYILTSSLIGRLKPSRINENEMILLEYISQIYHPQLRIDMLENALEKIQGSSSLTKKWSEVIDFRVESMRLVFEKLFEVADLKKRLDLLNTAIRCLTDSKEPPANREKLQFIVSFVNASPWVDRSIELLKAAQKFLKDNDTLDLSALLNKLSESQAEAPKDARHLASFLLLQMTNQPEIIGNFNRQIFRHSFKEGANITALLGVLIKLHQSPLSYTEKEIWLKEASQLTEKQALRDSLKVLDVFLSQPTPKIPKDNIADINQVGGLFKIIYNRKSIDPKRLMALRAPEAFLLFHARLLEIKDSRLRKEMLEISQKLLDHTMAGTLREERHDESKNPHLKQIFDAHAGLKKTWMTPLKRQIKDLLPDAKQHSYAGFEVIDAEDPTDVLLLGSDMKTCMALDRGLNRIPALGAYTLDGKYHNIMVKDSSGRIIAETQIELMWDDENHRAVLYQEKVNYKEAPRDKTLFCRAIREYCKQKAEQVGLPLVSKYDDEDEMIAPESQPLYQGTIKSLYCPNPFEWVDSKLDFLMRMPYSIEPACVIFDPSVKEEEGVAC